MYKSKIYIIVINYGTPEHTIECLDSICNNNYKLFHIILVDISNIKQSINKISNWIKNNNKERITLLKENSNNGFAFANNIGIKYSLEQNDCDFIWILNNDTVIDNNALNELITCYQNLDNPGFIGSKIMDFEETHIIQNVGGTFNKWSGYSILIGMGEHDKGQFDNTIFEIDYIVGASMFFHSSLIDRIGFMPEDYFLYYEDIDWCITAQKKGLKNITCTKSIIYHKQGVSTGAKLLNNDNHLNNKKYLYDSYLTLYYKHFKWLLPVAYFILLKQIAGRIFHRQFKEAAIILKTIFGR